MENLTLIDGGYTVKAFEVTTPNGKDVEPMPMLYIETANPSETATLTFHRSTDGQTFSAHPETMEVTGFRHEVLYGLKKGEFVKITSNKQLSNPKIMW